MGSASLAPRVEAELGNAEGSPAAVLVEAEGAATGLGLTGAAARLPEAQAVAQSKPDNSSRAHAGFIFGSYTPRAKSSRAPGERRHFQR